MPRDINKMRRKDISIVVPTATSSFSCFIYLYLRRIATPAWKWLLPAFGHDFGRRFRRVVFIQSFLLEHTRARARIKDIRCRPTHTLWCHDDRPTVRLEVDRKYVSTSSLPSHSLVFVHGRMNKKSTFHRKHLDLSSCTKFDRNQVDFWRAHTKIRNGNFSLWFVFCEENPCRSFCC